MKSQSLVLLKLINNDNLSHPCQRVTWKGRESKRPVDTNSLFGSKKKKKMVTHHFSLNFRHNKCFLVCLKTENINQQPNNRKPFLLIKISSHFPYCNRLNSNHTLNHGHETCHSSRIIYFLF